MMDHRSISFRAGPDHGISHLADCWRSWAMVPLWRVVAKNSSC